MTSIIIVNHNGLQLTRALLSSLVEYSPNNEVIVVDNGSTDGSAFALQAKFPRVRCIALAENRGFGAANNLGARAALGEHLFFLNNDTLLRDDCAAMLEDFLRSNPRVGACGPKLIGANGQTQYSIGSDPTLWGEMENRRRQRRADNRGTLPGIPTAVDWVTGAALMIRKDVFHMVGGFDERYFMYFEDADLCRRVRDHRFLVYFIPGCSITHFGGDVVSESKPPHIQVEYRASQVRYYDRYAFSLQRLLLKTYLGAKYGWRLVAGTSQQKSVAKSVFRILAG